MSKEFEFGMYEENVVVPKKKYHELFEAICHWKDKYDDEHRRCVNLSSTLSAVIDQHNRQKQAMMLLLEKPNLVENVLDEEEIENGD